MPLSQPFGLALSGGGFRTTAFHLGVLKRLREVGLLEDLDLISTVSGGSIAGAYWVHWQALKGDTFRDADEWDKFESSLIQIMRNGLRGRLWWIGFAVPFFVATAVTLCFLSGSVFRDAMALLASFLFAYLVWDCLSSVLLEWGYKRIVRLDNTTISDLQTVKGGAGRDLPALTVNACALNSGEHLIFTTDILPIRFVEGVRDVKASVQPIPMPQSTCVARAVAASSAFPLAFKPIKIKGPRSRRAQQASPQIVRPVAGNIFQFRETGTGPAPEVMYFALDGGVFDNQGLQALLHRECPSALISDASSIVPYQLLHTADAVRHTRAVRVFVLQPFEREIDRAIGRRLQEDIGAPSLAGAALTPSRLGNAALNRNRDSPQGHNGDAAL